MNVLLLTPDAVGSTLLQRLITIYMQFHEFDQPVINLHELTNGLERFYSPDFNRELLCKPQDGKKWGYYQSLEKIVEILESVDHYKTARLAQYHIRARQDSVADQTPFYQYLDQNFFIISCRRRNLFEHALSWGLNKITKKLNVYSANEKIDSFFDIYKNKVELDLEGFEQTLNRYRFYLAWSEDNFNISSYFYYEDHIANLEKYILNLPIFASQTRRITWKDTYDIEFSEWNRCHYYASNIGSIALENPDKFHKLLDFNNSPELGREIVSANSRSLLPNLPIDQQSYVKTHLTDYLKTHQSIKRMRELGILVTEIPIKKQTFVEKKFMISNFDQCLMVFNRWAEVNHDIATPISPEDLSEFINDDLLTWKNTANTTTSSDPQQLLLSSDLLLDQNDDRRGRDLN